MPYRIQMKANVDVSLLTLIAEDEREIERYGELISTQKYSKLS